MFVRPAGISRFCRLSNRGANSQLATCCQLGIRKLCRRASTTKVVDVLCAMQSQACDLMCIGTSKCRTLVESVDQDEFNMANEIVKSCAGFDLSSVMEFSPSSEYLTR